VNPGQGRAAREETMSHIWSTDVQLEVRSQCYHVAEQCRGCMPSKPCRSHLSLKCSSLSTWARFCYGLAWLGCTPGRRQRAASVPCKGCGCPESAFTLYLFNSPLLFPSRYPARFFGQWTSHHSKYSSPTHISYNVFSQLAMSQEERKPAQRSRAYFHMTAIASCQH
jgi:hypothetical protein